MRVADEIAQWLADKGITHAFGVIGGGNVALWGAIVSLGKTQIVSCHHEQAAAMAAAYYYRISGRLALCLVTTGAGSTNAITGVMAAYMDGVPLLVISGNEPSRHMGADTRIWGVQGYGSYELAKGFTKESTRLDAATWRQSAEFMHDYALHAPQGPVWIDLPKDVQNAAA